MTKLQLEALCAEWQKRLRLQDWKVEIKFASQEDLRGKDGECYSNLPRKRHYIRVVRPKDWPPGSNVKREIEDTVIHELLHAHMEAFVPDSDDPRYVSAEQAIDALAGAFTSLKYRGRK